MKINNQNTMSFGTNIKFVSPTCFTLIGKRIEKHKACEVINDWYIKGKPEEIGYRENVYCGLTGGIRSCTAGLTVKKGGNAPLFWHIWDKEENINNMSIVEEKIQGDNAIIVGSKSVFYYSKKLCNKFQKAIRKKRIPATILRNLARKWEAFMAYTSKDDTMYLCVMHCDNPFKYVKSMNDLKKIFSTVKISPTDNIEFVNIPKGILLAAKLKV